MEKIPTQLKDKCVVLPRSGVHRFVQIFSFGYFLHITTHKKKSEPTKVLCVTIFSKTDG